MLGEVLVVLARLHVHDSPDCRVVRPAVSVRAGWRVRPRLVVPTCILRPLNGFVAVLHRNWFRPGRSIQTLASGHHNQGATTGVALSWTKQRFRWSRPGQEVWFLGVISVRMSVRVTLMPQHSNVAAPAVGSRGRVLNGKPRSACGGSEK